MTIEIIFFVSIIAFITSVTSLWAFGHALSTHKQRIVDMYSRLNYLEVGLHYHGLIPMPWEMDDFETSEKLKDFKCEGNVVYLQKEE